VEKFRAELRLQTNQEAGCAYYLQFWTELQLSQQIVPAC
jgi:hypothetical protein